MTQTLPNSSLHRTLIQREHRPDVDLTVIQRASVRELHFTLRPQAGEPPSMLMQRLGALLEHYEASVVRQEVFGSLAACMDLYDAMNRRFGETPWPVLWVEGESCTGDALAGLHVFAVAGVKVETVSLDGRVVGRVFNDGHARHCLLGDVGPADVSAPRDWQAAQTFENLEAALNRAGMAMTDVARTWLFLDDILAWYGSLNKVRRDFFEKRHLFDQMVPASTGIGVRNPVGAALVAGAWAVQPANGSLLVREVPSPLQCPAPSYGSCFSRAVEIVTPGFRRLLISGTASIEPKGASVCAGDVDGQIDLTMQVVRALLVSRGMDYVDVTRATAYLRHPADLSVFTKWRDQLGLQSWPLVTAQAIICREELLFEIELDAMAPVARSGTAAGTSPPSWEI